MALEVTFHSFQSTTVMVSYSEPTPLKAIPCKSIDAAGKKKITEYTVKINHKDTPCKDTPLVPFVIGYGYLDHAEIAKTQSVCREWRQQVQESGIGVQSLLTEKYNYYTQVGDPKQKAQQKAQCYAQKKSIDPLRCAHIMTLCQILVS